MLPIIATENLADYIDVFCESGFFSPTETDEICKAGAALGLKPKLHVNQLNSIGGIEIGIENNAISLDRLETLTANEIELLSTFKGTATLLPTAAFFCECNTSQQEHSYKQVRQLHLHLITTRAHLHQVI